MSISREQFLVDRGIVEKKKPFDAHEYLISNGYAYDDEHGEYDKDVGGACIIRPWTTLAGSKGIQVVYTKNFLDVTKQSCDKAIKLIDCLIALENDEHMEQN